MPDYNPEINQLIEPWNELVALLDELGVRDMLAAQLPPHYRYRADRLQLLIFEIDSLIEQVELDELLAMIEIGTNERTTANDEHRVGPRSNCGARRT